jgi:hypothetical protein
MDFSTSSHYLSRPTSLGNSWGTVRFPLLCGGVRRSSGRWHPAFKQSFVPLALTLLGPVIVNILLFHVTMAPDGLPMALVVTALWSVVFFRARAALTGLFLPAVESSGTTDLRAR